MWSHSKRDRCIRPFLLTVTRIVCFTLVFIFFVQSGKKQKPIQKVTTENRILAERQVEEKCIPVCDSRNCILQANTLLKSINPDVDPCENFQKLVCGKFHERTGPDERGTSGFSRAHVMMLRKIRDVIENHAAPPGSASSKLKVMYDSCVNIGSSDLRGTEDFKQVLRSLEISNWPNLPEDFNFSEAGLPVLLATLKSYYEVHFLNIELETITEESSIKYYKVQFKRYMVESSTIPSDAATDILKYFDIGIEDIEVILNDYDIVKNTLLNLHEENNTECEGICDDVHIDCSSPEDGAWVYICDTVRVFLNLTHQNDNLNQFRIAVEFDNIFSVKNFILRLKSLPDRSVANFFVFNFLWNHLEDINFFFRKKKKKYYQYFSHANKPVMEIESKRIYCTERVVDFLSVLLESEYVPKYLRGSIIDEVVDIHENFTMEIGDMIAHQEWIPTEQRTSMERAIKSTKSSLIQLKNGVPYETPINEFMKMFNPTVESFFLNTLEFVKTLSTGFSQKIIPANFRPRGYFRVNAGFGIEDIVYDYGILFPPFYYPGHKRLINRVTFAPVVIHEIGHFVVYLLSSNKNSTREVFLGKQQCIEDQFSKFKFEYLGENLNGTSYKGENLADNLAQAYLDKLLDDFESSDGVFSLPGLEYSPKQQLYMSVKEQFCSKSNLEVDILFKKFDSHAPNEYRIIGTLQNSRRFAEAFHCPEGSYMNPSIKCSLLE